MHYFTMYFKDGYTVTIPAETLFQAMWEVDAESKIHGYVVYVR